ncbi:MAG: UDP-N-acetylmuramoyl-L-alanyl-D-glutamate--2,6-diaminopimelate ligase [Gemmatimonadetes bacterium]|nr:UDP-N-acetylmuramoyl-L-alanyl-D-glutamate--2,6-diaminopimelate ligase [Gemmatimonadota bacterium]
MTPIPVARLVTALADAGLLVTTTDALPEAVADMVDDSRGISAGAAFVAVRGHAQDGHAWLAAARHGGAALAIVEDAAAAVAAGIPALVVRDGRRAAGVAAAAFHGWPARALIMVGVTGTNGKTTTVGLLRHLLHRASAPAASIGTLGVLVGSPGEPFPGGQGLTTPGPVELQRLLRALADHGVRTVAMEVSSHALDQRRVEGVAFAAAAFTNLTRDHLDYHGTMKAYRDAKLRLLGHLAPGGRAVLNGDDPTWDAVEAPEVWRFGVRAGVEVGARDLRFGPDGSRFLLVGPQGAAPVSLPLLGDFNVANALAAAAVALAVGRPVAEVAERLATVPQVAGRLERIHGAPTVLCDYAHTPDALERALQAVRPFAAEGGGRVIVVFGCGGDRDRGKRPEMGRVAEALADVVVLTSDNPRTEDPERILDDIAAGMTPGGYRRVEDRRAAIRAALAEATARDVVLLAGKGHETYQIRGTTRYPFDERIVVAEVAAEVAATRGASLLATGTPPSPPSSQP